MYCPASVVVDPEQIVSDIVKGLRFLDNLAIYIGSEGDDAEALANSIGDILGLAANIVSPMIEGKDSGAVAKLLEGEPCDVRRGNQYERNGHNLLR